MKHSRPPRTAIALVTAVLGACGDSRAPSGAGPCADDTGASGCGDRCTGPGDCPDGMHCGDDARCTAECTAGGDECGTGSGCTADGRCSSDTGVAGDSCARVAVTLSPALPTVVLLIDRSSSMTRAISDLDATVRWTAVKHALIDEQTGIVKALQARVIFGASLYSAIRASAEAQPGAESCPIMVETPQVALDNFAAIRDLLVAHEPADGTPTEAAIRHVTARFPPSPDGRSPRVLLLATDGEPDTCELGRTSDASRAGVEDAVADARQLGITTYVLSVGDEIARSHLQRIANKGLGQPREAGTATVYLASTADQLVQSFEQIIRGVRSCDLGLQGTLDPARAIEGQVVMDGVALAHGSDWEVVDPRTLRLVGAACAAFRTRDAVQLSAEFPCGVLVE